MIYSIVGKPGSGKSYYLTMLARKFLLKGKRVFSNVKIDEREFKFKSYQKKKIGILYYYSSLQQFRVVYSGVILMDQTASYFSARDWANMDPEDMTKFQQHRQDLLDIYFTSQNLDFVDKQLRLLSNYCIEMNNWKFLGYFTATSYYPEEINKEKRKKINCKHFFFNKKIANAYDCYKSINRDIEKVDIEKTFVRMSTFFKEKGGETNASNK